MKLLKTYLALTDKGGIHLVCRDEHNIFSEDYEGRDLFEEKIVALFDAQDAMQFLIDCEWEGKIKQAKVEFEAD